MHKYTINQRVILHHTGADIPAIIREINESGKMVRLQVVGDKQNAAWVGLHWYPNDFRISPAQKAYW